MNHAWAVGVIGCALAVAAGAAESFDAWATGALFRVENGSLETRREGEAAVFVWKPGLGQASTLDLDPASPLFDRLRANDRLDFEYRLAPGQVNSLTLSTRGLASGARRYKVHEWTFAYPTTPAGQWVPVGIDLARPNWFPWDDPDGGEPDAFFRFGALALAPGTVVELRRLRVTPDWLLLKPDFELPVTWPVREDLPDGGAAWTIRYELINAGGRPDTIEGEVLSAHRRFRVAFATSAIPTKAGAAAVFELKASMPAADVKAAKPLEAEPVRVVFRLRGRPEIERAWSGDLVAPLQPEVRRQVVLAADEIAAGREAAADPAGGLARAIGLKAILAKADDFRSKKLLQIPGGHYWPGSGVNGDWKVGDTMPAITNAAGESEFGTAAAGQVWKKYLDFTGTAAESLGLAYLMTGDESYARHAVAYFKLLGRQYRELPFNKAFEAPWNGGPAILCASRISNASTYGGSIFMKHQVRLLSLVSESPAWSEADRKAVYEGFALPYALEIMKARGTVNNMTDIGNHNVLLLGLAFKDAGLVRWALLHPAGALNRLTDIDEDGFSSEGRPLNYHLAGMAEYAPSLAFLANSGLAVEIPRDRLLAALRMPFRRAALDGWVPNTGDCGRWQAAGANSHIDWVRALFPGEDWLDRAARPSSLGGKVREFRAGRSADPKAWRELLETEPRLFPKAGLAILREGATAQGQVMATLDYGRNLFHAHRDRLAVTLSAFGVMFSHGPGSLYNVGSGGMTNGPAGLRPFLSDGSLAQNVILADGQDQRPCVGRLLAWGVKPGLQVAAARVDGVWPGVSHTRCLVLAGGVVVVFDRMEADADHVYDFVYHNFGTLRPGDGWTAAPVQGPLGHSVQYEAVADPRRLTGSGPVRLEWDLSRQGPAAGGTNPPVRLDLWQSASVPGEVFIGDTGLNNPNTRTIHDAAPSLIHRVKGRRVDFVTVLAPRRGEGAPVAGVEPAEGGGVRVRKADGAVLDLALDRLLRDFSAGLPD